MLRFPLLWRQVVGCYQIASGVQLADKKEVLDFHLLCLSLCVRCRNSAPGEELSEDMQLQFDDLTLRMAQFILNSGKKKRFYEVSYLRSLRSCCTV
jgi:hypothetical protein